MRLYTGWQCLYCWYLSHIKDEFVRGHFGESNFACRLSTMYPTRFYSGRFENMFPQNWQNKPFWGVGKVLFSCLKCYSNLQLISQNSIVKYTWVPFSRRPKEAPARATWNPLWHPSTHALHLHHPGTRFKSRWRQWYKRKSHILTVSSVDDKTSDKLSYLTLQLQAGFHKLITISVNPPFIANSLSHALTYLSYWETLTNRTTLATCIHK